MNGLACKVRTISRKAVAITLAIALATMTSIAISANMAGSAAFAETIGVDGGQERIVIAYGHGATLDNTWRESVITLDGEWSYCAAVKKKLQTGVTVTAEDPVATGRWKQSMVTALAWANHVVWSDQYRLPSWNGVPQSNPSYKEKYAICQIMFWQIMNHYGYSDYDWFGGWLSVDGAGQRPLTGNAEDGCNYWQIVDEAINGAPQREWIGHVKFYAAGDAQDIMNGFWLEPAKGAIGLTKMSAIPEITDGNECYSLKNAVYGVFETEELAATHDASKALRTYRTNDAGSWESGKDFAPGTYHVAETTPPKGFALDMATYPVTVSSAQSARVGGDHVADVPQSDPVPIWARKIDAETADGAPQGAATLDETTFTVNYYDGYYNAATLPGEPVRSWTVTSDADGIAPVDDAHKVAGDEFYRLADGRITIPLGTVAVYEAASPYGYLPDSSLVQVMQVKPSGTVETVDSYAAPTFKNRVARGGVVVGKVDRQNATHLPQGAATFEGTTFAVVSENEQAVLVGGTMHAQGEVVAAAQAHVEDDGRCVARIGEDVLPVGSYSIRETSASEGYLLDDESASWEQAFEIVSDGQVVDLTDGGSSARNQVIRGDFAFSKVDGQTSERLGLVPFMVTSCTTGEHHVVMTDDNGMLSTAANWNPHTAKTNVNDDAVSEQNGQLVVDEALLDAHAGIWFDGRADAPCAPDDSLGALPFDTYRVEELRVSSNEGYELVSFDVVVARDGREINLGTIDDNPGPVIATTLSDENGAKLVPTTEPAVVTDAVGYANLDMRKQYTLIGMLHLVNEDGSDGGVVAEGARTFTPAMTNGTVDVEFSVDPNGLEGRRLVAFEQLVDSDDVVQASHEDLESASQSVFVPNIETTLVDAESGTHEALGTEVTLVDTVAYEGLAAGQAYTVTGVLHVRGDDGTDGGVALDAQGNPVTASLSFVAERSEGTVEVAFTFTTSEVSGKTLVAFEELRQDGRLYAVHADIADDGQSVTVKTPPEEPVKEPDTEQPEQDEPEEPLSAEPGDEPETPKPAEEEPSKEAPIERTPDKQAAKPAQKAAAKLPKTGDSWGLFPLALIPAGAIGLAGAALSVRKLERETQIHIERGKPRSQPPAARHQIPTGALPAQARRQTRQPRALERRG